MEHIYQYRHLYGLEILGNKSTNPHTRRPYLTEYEKLLTEDKLFKIDTVRSITPPDFDTRPDLGVKWAYKQLTKVGNYFWNHIRDIGNELKSGGISIATIMVNLKNSPSIIMEEVIRPRYKDILEFREFLQPFLNAYEAALRNLDQGDKFLIGLLVSSTLYLLWKTEFYIRHSVKNEMDLSGKVVLITGANSGIGERLTYAFLKRGAKVIMCSSDLDKTLQVTDRIKRHFAAEHGTKEHEAVDPQFGRESWEFNPVPLDYLQPVPHAQPKPPFYTKNLQFLAMDLGDLQSIWRGVYKIFEDFDTIDILINNAAVDIPSEYNASTFDGFEANFGVNYIGHFVLTNLIIGYTNIPEKAPLRIINVICEQAFQRGGLLKMKDIDAIRESERFLDHPYAASKFCNYLFHLELPKRLKASNMSCINSYAVCPPECKTNLRRYYKESIWEKLYPKCSPDAGIQTILHCAASPTCTTQTGQFYENCDKSMPPLYCGKLCLEKMCETLWDITFEKTKPFIDHLKATDVPLPRGNFYGNAKFRKSRLDLDGPDDIREYRPEPARELIDFRNYYQPIFDRHPYLQDRMKRKLCDTDLADIWLEIHGTQMITFGQRFADDEKSEDDYDPIYDKRPVIIEMKNEWVYS